VKVKETLDYLADFCYSGRVGCTPERAT